jgi:hypothetical protein
MKIDAATWLHDVKAAQADKFARLEAEAAHDEAAREVLADEYDQQGRHLDAAMLRLGFLMPPQNTRPRVDVLTNEEREQMDAWAQKWIAIGLRAGETEPVEMDAFAVAIAAAYESAQLAPPKQIVWTTSPIAAVLAGPIAMHVLGNNALRDAVGSAVNAVVNNAVGHAVDDAVYSVVDEVVDDAVSGAIGGAIHAVSRVVHDAVNNGVNSAVDKVTSRAVHDAARGATGRAVHVSVCRAVHDAVADAVDDVVGAAVAHVRDVVSGAVGSAVGRVYEAIGDAVLGAAVRETVNDAAALAVATDVDQVVRDGVNNVVDNAVHGAVGSAVNSAVNNAVGANNAVDDATNRAVHEVVCDVVSRGTAMREATREAMNDALSLTVATDVDQVVRNGVNAVGSAVFKAVADAVNGTRAVIGDNWYRYIGGQPWVGWGYGYRGPAYVSFLQDVCRLQFSPSLERAARAYQVICRTCWWLWPHAEFVIVAPRPLRLEIDNAGRLTLAEWADGSRIERSADGVYQLNVDVGKVLAMLGGQIE